MRKYIYIGIGGFLGAISRHLIQSIPVSGIPLNTLMINLSGSLLIAILLTFSLEIREFDSDVKLGITTGFLGAYTTFSTLCKETVGLFQNGNYFSAIFYMTISALLGLLMAYFGIVIARKIGYKLKSEFFDEDEE
jgi:CrcB protein